MNQCDGCRVNAPMTDRGNHQMPDGGFMGCTKDRYAAPSVDLEVLKAELQWCIENSAGPRTERALLWALEVVVDLEREKGEVKT